MFPDSNIAKTFTMGRTKSQYVVNHGLAPYFKDILLTALKISGMLVLIFDESLNDATQSCEMDMYIRFWDSVERERKVRYLGSSFMGHGTHQDLFKHLTGLIQDLDLNKLYQISMDGPNVNFKFYKDFIAKVKYISLLDRYRKLFPPYCPRHSSSEG